MKKGEEEEGRNKEGEGGRGKEKKKNDGERGERNVKGMFDATITLFM